MSWTKHFDKIYLINLKERPDRLQQATEELGKYSIPFELVEAVKNDIGSIGLYLTYYKLFENCLIEGYKNVLIFEDDVKFLFDPNAYFDYGHSVWLNIFKYNLYDIFYLGVNTHEPLEFRNMSTIPTYVVKRGYSTHAFAISNKGMKKVFEAMNKCAKYSVDKIEIKKVITLFNQIDVLISQQIQPDGECYCPDILLATQRNGYSDIEKKEVDMSYIEKRFIENTKHLS